MLRRAWRAGGDKDNPLFLKEDTICFRMVGIVKKCKERRRWLDNLSKCYLSIAYYTCWVVARQAVQWLL